VNEFEFHLSHLKDLTFTLYLVYFKQQTRKQSHF